MVNIISNEHFFGSARYLTTLDKFASITAKFAVTILGIFGKCLSTDFRNLTPNIYKVVWHDISSSKA